MMSRSRFDQVFSGMTSAAQKVYDCIPKADLWSQKQIVIEVQRRQMNMDFQIIAGCIDTLRRAGLVDEPEKGVFRQAGIREKAPKPVSTEKESNLMVHTTKTTAAAPAPAQDPLEVLGKLAQRAALLAAEAKAIADGVNDAVVEVMERIEADQKTLEKARQLKTLLQEIG